MVAELTALRDQIDDVDKALLNLLAKRLELVAEVGEVKSRFGLPIYVPEREATMLASRRAEAEAIGVPPDLIEDVLRRVMRESYSSENDKGFKTLCPSLRPVVIVGGGGQMGRLFEKMLTLSGYQVRILEQQDWPRARDIVADAGMVIVSVPIHVTEQVIAQLLRQAPAVRTKHRMQPQHWAIMGVNRKRISGSLSKSRFGARGCTELALSSTIRTWRLFRRYATLLPSLMGCIWRKRTSSLSSFWRYHRQFIDWNWQWLGVCSPRTRNCTRTLLCRRSAIWRLSSVTINVLVMRSVYWSRAISRLLSTVFAKLNTGLAIMPDVSRMKAVCYCVRRMTADRNDDIYTESQLCWLFSFKELL